MKIFLTTLSWEGQEKLCKLKESLMPALADIGMEYQWIIRDNGSKDKTVEIASTWGDNVSVIAYKNNLQNFSEGMNYIFNYANPADDDLVLLLNNDVIFGDTTSLTKMIKLLLSSDDIGVVGAKLLYTGTNRLQHAGVVFERSRGLPMHFRANEEDDEEASKNREFQAITGAVMLMRAREYRSICNTNKSGINGMAEIMVWAFDDIYACIAIKNLGKKILYCGETKIYHEESATLKKNPVNKLFMNANSNNFVNKWKGKYSIDIDDYKKDPKHGIYKRG